MVRTRADSKASAIEMVKSRAGSVMKEIQVAIKPKNTEEEKKRAILHALLQVFFEAHDPSKFLFKIFIIK